MAPSINTKQGLAHSAGKLIFRPLEVEGHPPRSLVDHVLNPDELSPAVTEAFGKVFGDDALKAPGLSRQKIKTFRAAATAVEAGLAVPALSRADPGQARATLLAIPGVGPWTADIMLMFCAGHPDILPVGDLAVRKAAERLLRCGPLADAGFAEIGERWAPHRAAVARLLWAYYMVPDDGAQSARPDSDVQGYPL